MSHLDKYSGQTALVTGASSGIGKAMAQQLAAAKINLILVARRETVLKELAVTLQKQHGIKAQVIAHDLAEPGAAQALFGKLKNGGHRIDLLINNAGVGLKGPFNEHTFAREAGMLRLNVNSVVELTHLLLPGMRERKRGAVLFVASLVGHMPVPYFANYAATKAYVRSFSAALKNELRGTGVTVTCLSPGGTRTDFFSTADYAEANKYAGAFMSPARAAAIGLKALAKGRGEVVAGWSNLFSAWALKFVPQRLKTWMAGLMMRLQLGKQGAGATN